MTRGRLSPVSLLRRAVEACVGYAERIEDAERTIESTQLLVAARRFAGAVEVFVEWKRRDRK